MLFKVSYTNIVYIPDIIFPPTNERSSKQHEFEKRKSSKTLLSICNTCPFFHWISAVTSFLFSSFLVSGVRHNLLIETLVIIYSSPECSRHRTKQHFTENPCETNPKLPFWYIASVLNHICSRGPQICNDQTMPSLAPTFHSFRRMQFFASRSISIFLFCTLVAQVDAFPSSR